MNDKYSLTSGYSVRISLTSNSLTCKYSFYNDSDEILSEIVDVLPLSLKPKGQVMMELKSCIDPDNTMKSNAVQNELRVVKKELNSIVNSLRGELDIQLAREQQAKDLAERRMLKKAENKLKNLNYPILYIGSLIDWLTADERINTLICFSAFCSQVILKKPISVIGYGESASGKTFVGDVALSLIPDKYIVDEKSTSPAALFNRAKTDKYYYDGKIVNYGDMGGQNDRDNQQDTLNLMKELQSDGKLTKPISIKNESGDWITVDLELIGNPCLFYSTIPTFIDEQELSRSVVYSPKTDNRNSFNKRFKALSLKMGATYHKYESIKELAELVPYMVEVLRQKMENIVIINPYSDIILNFLSQSKFYKRDSEKYFNLMNVITAINYYNNPKATLKNGEKAIITSKDDINLFMSLLSPYLGAIAINIKPQSAEIYQIFKDNIDEWKYDGDDFKDGITVREYFDNIHPQMTMRHLRRHFSELYQMGFLKIVGKDGSSNIYDLGETFEYNVNKLFNEEEIYDFVKMELGHEIAEKVNNDKLFDNLDIMNLHSEIEEAPW